MSPIQSQSWDVAVVGGGAVGLFAAWRAAQRALRVVVLEREAPGAGTSRVAAGMIAPVSEATFGEPALLELALASARRYPAAAEELADVTGRDPGYRATGTLLIARDRDAAEALEREAAFRRSLELPVASLRPSEARRREPALAPAIRAALDIPDDHQIDPRALCATLAAAIERAGGTVRSGAEVAAIEVDAPMGSGLGTGAAETAVGPGASPAGRVGGVRLASGERVAAGQVVVAAGPWSPAIGGVPEAERPPVRPVKGQILRLRDPGGPGLLSTVVRTEDVYVVPRGDGRYVVGATMEERGWDAAVTVGAIHDLLRHAAEVLPGVLELELVETSVGMRPGTPDNAPAIGPDRRVAGLHWATGHFRHGILLAPITAELVLAGLTGEDAGISEATRAACAPGRFVAATIPAAPATPAEVAR